jgi:uncharacterized membrane protein (UPF0182 family)
VRSQPDRGDDQPEYPESAATLRNQNDSRVIRGKQIAASIANSFPYVAPLYLTAAATEFPLLKRVIAITISQIC